MRLPQIQIQSTPARLGIQTDLGKFEIKQGRAELNIESTPAVIDIKNAKPEIIIDQSKTWDALTGGKPISFWNRVYSSYTQFPVSYVEKTVQDYNQIGDLTAGGNPIAEIARQSLSQELIPIQVYGEASHLNVKFDAVIQKPEINVQPGRVNIQSDIKQPEVNFQRGKVQIYMEQYASITITPPAIDMSI